VKPLTVLKNERTKLMMRM